MGLRGALNERNCALLGILAPLIAIFFIAVSIVLSPWFSWGSNALSDLGRSVATDGASKSEVAPLFNFGLLLCGFLIIVYSFTSFRKHARYTSYVLVVAGLMLQLVATFDEVYGSLHFLFSVLFFAALGFASLSYALERRSVLAFAALVVGSISWILYGLKIYSVGIAVPETISSMAVVVWIVLSALKIYFRKTG
jgi:hypothetical membrane protein